MILTPEPPKGKPALYYEVYFGNTVVDYGDYWTMKRKYKDWASVKLKRIV